METGAVRDNIHDLLVDDGGLKVHKDRPGDVLEGIGLGEDGVEGVVSATESLVRGHLAVWLDAGSRQ